VVHGISLPPGEFGGPWIDLLFTNALPPDGHPYFARWPACTCRAPVDTSHRRGRAIRPLPAAGLHAGVSSWAGRERCNDYSIGIELEGADHSPYESTQYAMLARVIAELCRSYPQLTPDRIVGHSDVAPGRKSDPGPSFDWPRLRSLVQFELEVAPP